MESFLAGAASLPLSPRAGDLPLPQREKKRYVRVDEPIYVRAVCVAQAGQRALLISCELFGLPFAEELRARLAQRTGIASQSIVLCDTYNHCAPREDLHRFDTSSCGPDAAARTSAYMEFCMQQCMAAAVLALKAIRPAKLFIGHTECPVAMNRDQALPSGWGLGKNPTGAGDHKLTLIALKDEHTGRSIATLVQYALYGNCCYLAGDGNELGVHGDLPGRVCTIMEGHTSAPVLWLCGAAGDQDPLMLSSMPDWQADGARPMRQMTWDEVAPMREYQAQWIVGCAQEALSKAHQLCAKRLRTRHIQATLAGRDGKAITAHATLLWLGTLFIIAVSGAPVARMGASILDCLPDGLALLVTHADSFTGYLVDEPHTDQPTFETTQMAVPFGMYERVMLPLIRKAVRQMAESE